MALLAVNNLRDELTDAKAGKRTLVVRFGETFGKAEYLVALAAARGGAGGWAGRWAASASRCSRRCWRSRCWRGPVRRVLAGSGPELNLALGATARFQLVFGLLFAWGVSR